MTGRRGAPGPSADRAGGPGPLHRAEQTPEGRAVISALVVLIVASVVISSLNDSPLRRSLLRDDQALLNGLGLDQRWNLFAPDPRRRDIDVRAHIRYRDRTTETWTLPRGAPAIGVYGDHRWRKWMDNAAAGGGDSPLWAGLARWLAKQRQDDGKRPQNVRLVGRFRDLQPPGEDGPDRGPWQQIALYELRVP